MQTLERVVVTGLGVITSLGLNVEDFWQALLKGQSGIREITRFAVDSSAVKIAGLVHDLDVSAYIPHKQMRRMSRFAQLALIAATEAISDAKLTFSEQLATNTGVLLGCGIGGMDDMEESTLTVEHSGPQDVSPFLIVKMAPNMAAYAISKNFGLHGYNNTVATGCAAGTQAIGDAAQIIRSGRAQVMITGGTESALCPTVLAGFTNMKAVSTNNEHPQQASRPFDKDRDGFVPGEGSGILVLESLSHALQRGARIYAELIGYGATADAYHLIAPDPTGKSAARAMQLALEDAAITPEDIDYVNAHGTSTQLGDVAETKAIKQVLGEHAYQIPVNSTKSMIGHLLGAAGGVEAVATVKSLVTGWIHPTINLDAPDPECDLDYVPHVARYQPVAVALSNSFGLGGQNASIILRRWDE
jgi:3-oxoacyl-[acyl-carrier-protein] synthase II